jgi:signal transduction histidine kinase/CheY-like chemotaxis protein
MGKVANRPPLSKETPLNPHFGLTADQRDAVMGSIYERGNWLMQRFLLGHLVTALLLATTYQTWRITFIVSAAALLLFYIPLLIAPKSSLTRSACGMALQLFVALHIFQQRGMQEMHLFFFTAFTMMIVYCDWASMWPGALIGLAQRFFFAFLQNTGVDTLFFEEPRVGFTKLWFYFGIAIGHVAICGWWAQMLRNRALQDAAQKLQIAEGRRRVEEQLEAARRSESALQTATRDLLETQRLLQVDIQARQAAQKELREKEEILRSVLSNIGDAVIVADRESRFLVFNPAAEKLFSYTSRTGGVYDWARQFLFFEPSGLSLVGLDKLPISRATRGEVFDDIELMVRKLATGEVFWINVSGRPLRDQSGQLGGGVIVCRDITERKRAEEVLWEKERQLREAQKMEAVGRLAGGVAHDFNNLLTVIAGYSSLLMYDDTLEDSQKSHAEQIQLAAERATALTSQLLTFSRRQVVQHVPVDLNQSVRDIDNMINRLVGEDVELQVSLMAGIGVVRADPGQIAQVIMNLAINARDAMPKGGRLRIETRDVTVDETMLVQLPDINPGRYVMLTVSDTGVGMSKETMSHIFEPFFTTKEKGKGTGLGLSIVYGIVKQGGGHISVESTVGDGSTFTIYFPVTEAVVPQAPEQGEVKRVGGSETILLVEDEAAVRGLVRNVLTDHGYRVLEASCGSEAISVVESCHGRIDMVLSDVVMPGMKGPELVERLGHMIPDACVLYMSGYTDTALDYFREADHSAALLMKPFSLDVLLRKIREVLAAGESRVLPGSVEESIEALKAHL